MIAISFFNNEQAKTVNTTHLMLDTSPSI